MNASQPTLDLIWNVSLICPWDCEFCCTDAVQVTRRGQEIRYREASLREEHVISPGDPASLAPQLSEALAARGQTPTIYDWALRDRQLRGREATLEEKLAVVRNVARDRRAIWDFAGGDPLACFENFLVIREASKLFGRDAVSVTSTGAGLDRYPFEEFVATVGRYEFTYDEPGADLPILRPKSYNRCTLSFAARLASAGVKTKAQVPLHPGNMSEPVIRRLYSDMAQAGITEILLMRTFPSGRGADLGLAKLLDATQIRRAVGIWTREADRSGASGPRVRVQCALRTFVNAPATGSAAGRNPCDLIRTSFGINPRGLLLASAWATNSVGDPLSDEWVLGDLRTQSIAEILATKKVERLSRRLDENFGHCKIFAFVHSARTGEDRMFDQADPILATAPSVG